MSQAASTGSAAGDRPLELTATSIALDGTRLKVEDAGPLREAIRRCVRAGRVVLLGEFGSGKTHVIAEAAAEGLGVAVPLRLLDADRPVEEELARIVGRSRLADARSGEVPLLLDGFDEAQFPPERLDELFMALDAAAGEHWLITSRPGFFRTSTRKAPHQIDTLSLGIQTLAIDPVADDVVRQRLAELGGDWLVESVDGLTDLASSPMLYQVARAAWPFIDAGRPIDAWGVFDAWIRRALETDDDTLERLHRLAWEIVESHGFRPTGLRFDTDALERHGIPLATRSALMVTDMDGHWRFGHRSVLEFFVAGRIAPRIAGNQGHGPDDLSGFLLSSGTRAFLVGRVGTMPVQMVGDRVRIPRGNFVAGGTRALDEQPLRIQHLAQPVWVDRFPITNRQFAEHLRGHPDEREDANYLPHWPADRTCPAGREMEPLYGIWPEDADAYAASVGARLPTADEWEKAVRGIDGRVFPWGDHFRRGRAVTAETGVDRPLSVTAFGCHGDAGLFSSVGGAFEYTATPWDDQQDRGRVVMGGCFTHRATAARPSLRLSHKLSGRLKTGMRLAWDAS